MAQTPTQEEIDACIAHFTDIAPKIRQTNMFGDSNRDKIEAAINVLEEAFDEDKIYEKYENPNNEDDRNELDAALDARAYLDGEYDDSDGPFIATWDGLIQK